MIDGLNLRKDEVFFNTRYKYIIDEFGEAHLLQKMCSKFPCFNPTHAELVGGTAYSYDGFNLTPAMETEFMTSQMYERLLLDDEEIHRQNQLRARARAKSKVFDIALANYDFKYFVTWTLDSVKIDRYDYNGAVRKLGQWLDNRVRRNCLKYLIVPELHKDGAVHFHGLVNDVIKIRSSGTYIRPDGGKPVKLSTLRRQHIDVSDCSEVFNLTDWENGFTTAIPLYGERVHTAAYISKYITKSTDKVGGRYYLSGGNLFRPMFLYANEAFPTDTAPEQMFDVVGNTFACQYYNY